MANVGIAGTTWFGTGIVVGTMITRTFPTEFPLGAVIGLGVMLVGFLFFVTYRKA